MMLQEEEIENFVNSSKDLDVGLLNAKKDLLSCYKEDFKKVTN